MGGGKTMKNTKIPSHDDDKRSPLSGTSTSTCGGPWEGRGGSGVGDGGDRHLQIPKSTDGGLQDPTAPRASTGQGQREERVNSHSTASPSPRCGFGWLHAHLEQGVEEWRERVAIKGDFWVDDTHYRSKFMRVPRGALPRIIGRGGQMIQRLEQVCGVFASVVDTALPHNLITFVGSPHSILLAEFAVDMLNMGYFGVLESLQRAGF